jgi:two-component system response regulator RegX3
MWRVVVVEEREPPRVAALLSGEGLEIETTKQESDLVSAVVRLFSPDLVLFETVGITTRTVQLCGDLQSATDATLAVFCEHAPERDVLDAFDAGAQTVITEPIGSHELVARVRAVLRRVPPRAAIGADVITVGAVVLDRARRQVTVHGIPVPMPRKEFDIAELLMCRAGTVVSRVQIVRELWGVSRDTKTLDVQVGRLRAKLAAAEGHQRIVTVRGVGYRFVADDEAPPAALAPAGPADQHAS